jgi:hypothetical protein
VTHAHHHIQDIQVGGARILTAGPEATSLEYKAFSGILSVSMSMVCTEGKRGGGGLFNLLMSMG